MTISMIELDTPVSEQSLRENIVLSAGARPIGERAGFAWFTDPITRSTLLLPIADVSVENVERKLILSREQFSVRPALPHMNDVELIERIAGCLQYVAKDLSVADQIVIGAADAAARVFIRHELSHKSPEASDGQ